METPGASDSGAEVLRRIRKIQQGGRFAAADLTRLLYAELRKLAGSLLSRNNAAISLHPTSLVHEAFMKLVGPADPGWEGRRHFFGAAAQAMRELIVDEIRRRNAAKRGAGQARITLTDVVAGSEIMDDEILALHESLGRLETRSARQGRVVALRYFAGFTVPEIAELLGVSLTTVERDWRFARAWLRTEMTGG